MKVVGFWVLLQLTEATLMFLFLNCSSAQGISLSHLVYVDATDVSRNQTFYISNTVTQGKFIEGSINLEDYHQIDPVPSSSAAVTSGPIEHGSPLMPYIPKLPPPHHPRHYGSSVAPSPA
ncbi:hypothetical protein KPL71_022672 [Citrus sinensis]|uniref:Uncharacterized protein n=1 Tax=Citrus sinensis TaxID=2711 RepID=A0ACB8IDU9_CITSI|nr:hypothetical protein KPL71_022672 [Citrus sinensis]